MQIKNLQAAMSRRVAARIGLGYALIAGAWIYASDALLAPLSGCPQPLTLLQTYKGWLFVAVTAALLYGLIGHLLAREYARQPAAGPSATPRTESTLLHPWLWQGARTPLWIFLALAGAIGGIGYLAYLHQQQALQTAKADELRRIADDKAAEIDHWLTEQRSHAEFIARDPFIRRALGRWLLAPTAAADEGQRLEQWLTHLKETFAYTAALLLDSEGQIRLSVGTAQLHPARQALARQALASGQVVLSELHWRQEVVGSQIDLDLIAPVQGAADGQPPLGALVLKIDPAQYLFPLIQSWPVTSPSAETLLVRREGEEIVYLNELRHRQGTALRLRLPLTSARLPAARAVRGERGVVEGMDYRQVPVLAAVRPVPNTAWFLVTKVDAEEVYAPLHTLTLWVAVVSGLLILAAGTGTALWWRQQHAGFVAERLRRELERQALAQRFDYLSKYANDSILLTDSQGQLLEANERAVATYGYAHEELLRLNVRDLHAPETRARLAKDISQTAHTQGRVFETAHAQGRVFETVHCRKDGTCFPAEVSSRRIELEGRPLVQSIIRDISKRKQAEAALRESQAQLQTIIENLDEGLIIADLEGRLLHWNRAALAMHGFASLEECPRRLSELADSFELAGLDGTVRPVDQWPLARIVRGEHLREVEMRIRRLQADWRRVYSYGGTLVRDARGEPLLAVVTVSDITERKRAEAALFEEKERAQVTLHSIGDGVITTDIDCRVHYLNPVAEILTGWSMAAAQGQPLARVFATFDDESRQPAPDPVARCLATGGIGKLDQALLRSRSGREYAIQDSAAPIRDAEGKVVGAVLVFSDVTERRRLAQSMAYQATHDSLTGLVNRGEFERRLRRVLEPPRKEGMAHALCYLDLDQFKVVNDTCGHGAGDKLLQQLGDLFKAHVRKRDTLARLGGDEFGVLLEHCSVPQALRVAEALRQAVAGFRFASEDKSFRIGVSIGLVPIDQASGNLTEVLGAADAACYLAKDQGRNRIHVYQADDAELARRHGEMRWAVRIPLALEENRFQLYRQPIAPLAGGGQTGEHYEVLLRLEENGQIASPGAFLAAAERYNLAAQLDRWVIRAALRRLGQQPALRRRLFLCSINLSGQSLNGNLLLPFILEQIKTYDVPPEKLCFEITETAAIANLANAIDLIQALKTEGCRFALDDFGSGFSSFAYLRALPVDYLKIDGAFIKDIATDPTDFAIVKSMHEIAQVTGKRTVAEWVEDQPTLEKLRAIGVHYAQGYLIGRPRPWQE